MEVKGSQFSLFAMWVLEIKLRLLGLEAGTSTHSLGHLTGLLPFLWMVYVSAHVGGSEAEISSIEACSLMCMRVYSVWLHVWVDQRLMSDISYIEMDSLIKPRASTVWSANCGDSVFASCVLGLHIGGCHPR